MDGHSGDIEHAGDLLHFHAAEEAHFGDGGRPGQGTSEFGQEIIEPEDAELAGFSGVIGEAVDADVGAGDSAAALLGGPSSRVIDQDLAHSGGGDGHEVVAIVPAFVIAGHLEEGLVDEGGGLEGVGASGRTGGALDELRGGEGLELVVDEREEGLERVLMFG